MTTSGGLNPSPDRRRSASRRRWRWGRRRRLAWALSFGLALAIESGATFAQSLPQGGTVVGGAGTIQQNTPKQLTINQTSPNLAIDWQRFSVGAGHTVRFEQPSTSAIALNRVIGPDPSQILGQIQASGRVVIANPNGIYFGPSSRVDVNGLVASTANIRTADFMAGKLDFGIASLNPDARIVNEGAINITQGGFAVLAAAAVKNTGTVIAQGGTVVLAGTPTFALDFHGDGLLKFAATGVVNQAPNGANALVENTGTVSANGGRVLMTARAARDVINNVINTSGIVEARSARIENGEIVIDGGENGIVSLNGRVDASGVVPDARGGNVTILGEKVGLFENARLDVSGAAGGGQALVGGNYQGKGPEANAKMVYMDARAVIDASATVSGDGGRVILWSDTATRAAGHIDVSGARDGGFVEVSSKSHLDFRGTVNLRGLAGRAGHLLLDPNDITIGGTDTNITNTANTFGATGIGASVISLTTLYGALASGNVTVQTASGSGGNGDITIAGAIVYSGGTDSSLTLMAERDININAPVTSTLSNLDINLRANRDVTIGANVNTLNGAISTSNYGNTGRIGGNFSNTGTISTGVANISLNVTGNISINGTITTSGTVEINAVGLTQQNASLVGGGSLLVGGTGQVLLTDGSNDFGLVGISRTGTTSNVALTTVSTLNLLASTFGTGVVSLVGLGGFSQGGPITQGPSGGNVTISGGGVGVTLSHPNTFSGNVTLVGNAIGVSAAQTAPSMSLAPSTLGTNVFFNGGAGPGLIISNATLLNLANVQNLRVGNALSGTLSLGSGYSWSSAQNLTLMSGDTMTIGAPINATGSGSLTLNSVKNVAVSADIATNTGDILITGNVQIPGNVLQWTAPYHINTPMFGAATGNFNGVTFSGGKDVTSTSGNIAIAGKGGTTGGNRGVFFDDGSVATAGGNITVVGASMTGIAVDVVQWTAQPSFVAGGSVVISGHDGTNIDAELNGVLLNGAGISAVGSISVTGRGGFSGLGDGLSIANGAVLSSTGGGSITLTGNTTNIDTTGVAFTNGPAVSTTGTGAITISSNKNVMINGAVTTVDGNILITGGNVTSWSSPHTTTTPTFGPPTAGDFVGVAIGSGAVIESTNGANIAIAGRGGNGGAGPSPAGKDQHGVSMAANAIIQTNVSGSINIVGQGGASPFNGDTVGTGGAHHGLYFNGDVAGTPAQVIAVDGNITLTGTGGGTAGTSDNNGGVALLYSRVRTTGTGAIDITGTAGFGASRGVAVVVDPTAGASIASAGGIITIIGTGGGSANEGHGFVSRGIHLDAGLGAASIVSTGSGSIQLRAITGTAGTGLYLSGHTVTVGGGSFTGDLELQTNMLDKEVSTNLTLSRDTIAGGTLTFRPVPGSAVPGSDGTTIGVAGGSGALQIPIEFLTGPIVNGFSYVQIGSPDQTGAIEIGGGPPLALDRNLRIVAATAPITITGPIDIAAQTLELLTGGAITQNLGAPIIGSGILFLSGTGGGTIQLDDIANAFDTVVLNRGSSSGNITISALDAAVLDISGTSSSGALTVSAPIIEVNSPLTAPGPGSIRLTATTAIDVHANITTVGGNIVLIGNASWAGAPVGSPTFNGSSGDFVGVKIDGVTIDAGSGTIAIAGKGGDAGGGSQFGVQLLGGAQLQGSGPKRIFGEGGLNAGDSNLGVQISGVGTTVTGAGGSITIVGTGGAGTGNFNHGIGLDGGAVLTSFNGPINLTGTATNGVGIAIQNGSTISGGGSSAITLIGNTSGGGLGIGDAGTGNFISAGAGKLTLTSFANGLMLPNTRVTSSSTGGLEASANSGDVNLSNPTNDLQGVVSISSVGTALLTTQGALDFGPATVGSGLTATAGGPITQIGAILAGSTVLVSTGTINLADPGNNFGSSLSLTGTGGTLDGLVNGSTGTTGAIQSIVVSTSGFTIGGASIPFGAPPPPPSPPPATTPTTTTPVTTTPVVVTTPVVPASAPPIVVATVTTTVTVEQLAQIISSAVIAATTAATSGGAAASTTGGGTSIGAGATSNSSVAAILNPATVVATITAILTEIAAPSAATAGSAVTAGGPPPTGGSGASTSSGDGTQSVVVVGGSQPTATTTAAPPAPLGTFAIGTTITVNVSSAGVTAVTVTPPVGGGPPQVIVPGLVSLIPLSIPNLGGGVPNLPVFGPSFTSP